MSTAPLSSSSKPAPRPADAAVESQTKRLSSRFRLVSKYQVKTWHALLVILFAAGFATATVFGVKEGYLQFGTAETDVEGPQTSGTAYQWSEVTMAKDRSVTLQGSQYMPFSTFEEIILVNFTYDRNVENTVTINDVQIRNGVYRESRPSESKDFVIAELVDARGEVFADNAVSIPEEILVDDFQKDKRILGNSEKIHRADFSISLPYIQEGSIRIKDGAQNTLAIYEVEKARRIDNSPKSYVLPGIRLMNDAMAETAEDSTGILDIVFISEDFSQEEMAIFQQRVDAIIPIFSTFEPYASRLESIHFWRIENLVDLGCAPMGSGDCMANAYNVASEVPHDQVMVLADGYIAPFVKGYAYLSQLLAVCSVSGYLDDYCVVHEMGHSLGGLADEYGNSINISVPRGPNCAIIPCDEWQGIARVGCYLGCGDVNTARPTSNNCIMNGVNDHFDPVDLPIIAEKVESFINVEANKPTVGLDIPENSHVSGRMEFYPDIQDDALIKRVKIFLDGEVQREQFLLRSSGISHVGLLNWNLIAGGDHTLTMTAEDIHGNIGSWERPIVNENPETKPDLFIGSMTQIPAMPNAGDQVGYHFIILNETPKLAPPSKLAITIDGTNECSINVPFINPGYTVTVEGCLQQIPAGAHVVTAEIDSAKQIAESNEYNNTARKIFYILEPAPDQTIIDDGDPYGRHIPLGQWESHPEGYGGDSMKVATGGQDFIQYSIVVYKPDVYSVYGWWPSGGSVSSVSYNIGHQGGFTEVMADQTQNSNEWNYLGTFSFNRKGYASFLLNATNLSGQFVFSDAIMFVRGNPPTISSLGGDFERTIGEAATFTSSATDPDAQSVSIRFDFGDGNRSDWIALGKQASVSASHAYENGGDYCVKAQAQDVVGAVSQWSNCHTIHIVLPQVCTSFSFPQPQGAWYLISLPVDPPDKAVTALFPDALSAFGWDYLGMKYFKAETLEPGRGYWVLMPNASSPEVCGAPYESYTAEYATPGWDLIGSASNPAALADNPPGSVVVMVSFDPLTKNYVFVDPFQTEPGKGYWIAMYDAPSSITVGGSVPAATPSAAPAIANKETWSLPLIAAVSSGAKDEVAFGIAPQATDQYDRALDRLNPPAGFGGSLDAFFLSSDPRASQLSRDYRSDALASITWTAIITGTQGHTGTLVWDAGGLPANAVLTLMHPSGASLDMRTTREYQFTGDQQLTIALTRANGLPALPVKLFQSVGQEGSTTKTKTPTFTFTIADPDQGQRIGYQIQVARDVNFTRLARDFTWTGSTTNPNSVRFDIRKEHALSKGSYWWRVQGTDETGAFSDWVYFGDRNKEDFRVK